MVASRRTVARLAEKTPQLGGCPNVFHNTLSSRASKHGASADAVVDKLREQGILGAEASREGRLQPIDRVPGALQRFLESRR